MPEAALGDTEVFGRADLDAAGFREGVHHYLLFEIAHDVFQAAVLCIYRGRSFGAVLVRDLGREAGRAQDDLVGEDDGPLDVVLNANVAGPIVIHEHAEGVRSEALHLTAKF